VHVLTEEREKVEKVKQTLDEVFEEIPKSKNVFIDQFSNDKLLGDAVPHELEYDDAIMEFVSGSLGQTNGILKYFNLQKKEVTKKQYMGHMKTFLPKLKEKVPKEKQADFMKGATTFVKYCVEKWDNLKFYEGASMNADGGIVVLNKDRTFWIFAASVTKTKA